MRVKLLEKKKCKLSCESTVEKVDCVEVSLRVHQEKWDKSNYLIGNTCYAGFQKGFI